MSIPESDFFSSLLGNSCGASQPSPPTRQPDQKAYADFNDSWQVTEPDLGYQIKYVRLISNFAQ